MKLADQEFVGPLTLDSEAIPAIRAVYFIASGDDPLYIGLTENLRARMQQHRGRLPFESTESQPRLFYWAFDEDQVIEARALETLLISILSPKYNKWSQRPESIKVREAKRQAEKASKFSTIVAGVTSSVVIALTASMLFGVFQGKLEIDSNATLENRINKIEANHLAQAKALSSLAVSVKALQKSIESTDLKPEVVAGSREISRIGEDLKGVAAKVSALESALNSDPAKSLAVPLLRKDLDNTRDGFKANLDQTKSEIDRIYDQNKWFIGLMFTIALSVLGMAASNFLSRRS